MKNLLTLFVLFLGLGMADAQTFDETVNYINKFFKEEGEKVNVFPYRGSNGFGVRNVMIEKNGKVAMNLYRVGNEQSVFFFSVFDFDRFSGDVYLLDTNNKEIGSFLYFPPTHISKIEKALKHLRTLCIKEKDLFE
mgnify:CR=1 FL=1